MQGGAVVERIDPQLEVAGADPLPEPPCLKSTPPDRKEKSEREE
jgi:hypothetical protein